MKKTIKVLLLFLLIQTRWASLHAQVAADIPPTFPVRVAIRLLDMGNGKPVPYASVRILGTKKGLVADSNGFFSIVITQKDSLKISSLGYYDLIYTKRPEKQINYYEVLQMRSKIFELSAVQVLGKRKKDLDNPFLRWEYKAKFLPKLWLFYTPTGEPPPAPGLMSPISYLYDRFSRRGKDARKLRDMVAERARRKWYASRYNAEKIQQWTNLGEDEMEAFMKFCPMPDNFLDEASDYEIIERTFRCLEEFDQREK